MTPRPMVPVVHLEIIIKPVMGTSLPPQLVIGIGSIIIFLLQKTLERYNSRDFGNLEKLMKIRKKFGISP